MATEWEGTLDVQRLMLLTVVSLALLSCSAGDVTEEYRITDIGMTFQQINEIECLDWPDEATRARGGQSGWDGWRPRTDDIGTLVATVTYCGTNKRDLHLLDVGGRVVPVHVAATEQL